MRTKNLTLAAAIVAALGAGAAPAVLHAEGDGSSSHRSTREVASDALITTKVKAALLKEQASRSLSIKVSTTNGVVELSGTADDSAQIDSAVRVARNIDGVQDVKNRVQLKQSSDPAKP